MRFTKGITFGFLIGSAIGVLIYLKLKRENSARLEEARSLRIHLPDTAGKTDAAPLPVTETRPDTADAPLEAVSGIGKVRADRLREGGIETLVDLAAATPEKVREILGPRVSLDKAAAFIAQAKDLR